jgi:hypothetical protein
MKKPALYVGLIWICALTVQANPIVLRYFSEFCFDMQNRWYLELHSEWEYFNLDEYFLRSLTDTSAFKPGLVMDENYLVITQDSLESTLAINPEGDHLELYRREQTYPMDYLEIPHLAEGQSICLHNDYHYLDNSPTIGLPNDTTNARCRIVGTVTDTSGNPLSGEAMDASWGCNTYFPENDLSVDTLGRFSVVSLATDVHFIFYKANYQTLQKKVQACPETTYTIQCQMTPDASQVRPPSQHIEAGFQLGENYPNPFNSTTFFEYTLPKESRVTVQIFDVCGRLVETLFTGFQGQGQYRLMWHAFAEPSGLYFYQVQAQGIVLRKKCLLIK